MSLYGLAFTQKAAGLYGLKSSAQGSGRKRFVIVRSTNRTQLLEPAGQERLRDMLAAHEGSLDLLRPKSQAAAVSRGAKLARLQIQPQWLQGSKPRMLSSVDIGEMQCIDTCTKAPQAQCHSMYKTLEPRPFHFGPC